MLSIGDFEKIWKWAQVKWWHLPIAIFIIIILFIIACIEIFIQTEKRWQFLTFYYSQLACWFGMQETWIIYYLPLITAAILTALTLSVPFLLLCYYVHGKIKDRDTKINKLNQAYICLRYAYKKAASITTRDLSYGANTSSLNEGGREHIQQQGQHELYIGAEKLARQAGIPEDA